MTKPETDNQLPLDRARAAAQEIRSIETENHLGRHTTSVAKDVDPIQDGPLSQAPSVQEAFRDARDGKVSEATPQEKNQHATSAAKHYEPIQGTTLDRAPNLSQNFAQVQNAPVMNIDDQVRDQSSQTGSQMVKDSKPYPYPAPKGPERKTVDREVFNERWHKEQSNALDRARAAAREVRTMEAGVGQNRESSRGLGMD